MAAVGGRMTLVLAAASIGAGTIATKAAYRAGAPPEAVLAARFAVAAIAVVAAGRLPRRLDRRAATTVIGAGLALWVCWDAELIGLAHMNAGTLIVLATTSPAWIVAINAVLWRERPRATEILAIAALLTGVAIMVDPAGASFTPIGSAGGLLTALSAGALIVIIERARTVPPATILAGALIIGCVLSIAAHPGALGEVVTNPEAAPYCAIVGGCAVLWAALVAIGIGSTPAVAAAMTFALEPVLVALLAYAILGERLSTAQIGGGAIVVASVTLVAASHTSGPPRRRDPVER
jgi:drug/metabolite transporter (DMT)-like permease